MLRPQDVSGSECENMDFPAWGSWTALSVCSRGLFIIDDKGILRQITINDLPVGRSVEETMRLVQAFQFTDKHGEGKLLQLFGTLMDVKCFIGSCSL